MRQLVKEKENSEFKPVKLRLKIDLVSCPARAEGLVNMNTSIPQTFRKKERKSDVTRIKQGNDKDEIEIPSFSLANHIQRFCVRRVIFLYTVSAVSKVQCC